MKKSRFLQATAFFAFNISLLLIFGAAFLGCQEPEKNDSQQDSVKGFSITQTNYSFPEANEAYTSVVSMPVSVTNTGNTAINVAIALSGANPDSFSLNVSSLELPANDSKTFTVSHKKGLREDIYTATVTVSAAGCETKSFNVSFTVDAAKEEKHLYIAFGQSNMQGPATIRSSDTQNISDRWQTLNVVAGTYASVNRAKSQWYKAVPPLIIPDSGLNNYLGLKIGLGPSDHFGRTMVTGTPNSITLGIVAVAQGDLALSSFRKYAGAGYFSSGQGGTVSFVDRDGQTKTVNRTLTTDSSGKTTGRPIDTERQGWTRYTGVSYSSLYNAIVTNVKLAQNNGWIVKGIIFHQGESGRGLEDKTWVEILKEIYDDILEDIGLEANSIPIICGQPFGGGKIESSTGNDGGANLDYQLNLDNRIQSTIPNAWVISSEDCGARTGNQQPDGTHFGSDGIQLLGERYGEKMLEVVYGY